MLVIGTGRPGGSSTACAFDAGSVDAVDDSGVVAARGASAGAMSCDPVSPPGASDHAAAARRPAAIALMPANHRRRARSASARCFCASAACAARMHARLERRRRRGRGVVGHERGPRPRAVHVVRTKRCHAGHRTCLNSPDIWCASRTRASRSRSSCRPCAAAIGPRRPMRRRRRRRPVRQIVQVAQHDQLPDSVTAARSARRRTAPASSAPSTSFDGSLVAVDVAAVPQQVVDRRTGPLAADPVPAQVPHDSVDSRS